MHNWGKGIKDLKEEEYKGEWVEKDGVKRGKNQPLKANLLNVQEVLFYFNSIVTV